MKGLWNRKERVMNQSKDTKDAKDATGAAGTGGTAGTAKAVNVYQTFNVNASVSSDYDVRKLSQELGQLSKQTAYGKGK